MSAKLLQKVEKMEKAVFFMERRQDVESCAWADIRRHYQQKKKAIEESDSPERLQECHRDMREWRKAVLWQSWQRSCWQAIFIAFSMR